MRSWVFRPPKVPEFLVRRTVWPTSFTRSWMPHPSVGALGKIRRGFFTSINHWLLLAGSVEHCVVDGKNEDDTVKKPESFGVVIIVQGLQYVFFQCHLFNEPDILIDLCSLGILSFHGFDDRIVLAQLLLALEPLKKRSAMISFSQNAGYEWRTTRFLAKWHVQKIVSWIRCHSFGHLLVQHQEIRRIFEIKFSSGKRWLKEQGLRVTNGLQWDDGWRRRRNNVLWASMWLHPGASVFQYTRVNLGIDTTVVLTCLDSLLPPLLRMSMLNILQPLLSFLLRRASERNELRRWVCKEVVYYIHLLLMIGNNLWIFPFDIETTWQHETYETTFSCWLLMQETLRSRPIWPNWWFTQLR